MDTHRLLQLLRPTRRRILASVIASLVVLLTTYGDVLIRRLVSGTPFNDSYVQQASFQQLTRLSDMKFVGVVVEILFWGGVGLVAYMVFLAISNTITEARNEIIITAEYTNKGSLSQRAKGFGSQVGAGLLVFALLLLTAFVFLPWWLTLFEAFLAGLPSVISFVDAFLATLGLAANMLLLLTASLVAFSIG